MTTTDASALAALILDSTSNQPPTNELRARLGVQAAELKLDRMRPLLASLERDPADPAADYVAADVPAPQLLHVSRAGVQARPFAASDRESVRWFAEKVNR
ncbi:MAG TPA: hypothetical protein VER98_09525, partial [Terriglobia bacterium]|nr:hypothetical protein [Terriglobia bacterium]